MCNLLSNYYAVIRYLFKFTCNGLYAYVFNGKVWLLYHCNLLCIWFQNIELIWHKWLRYSLNNSYFILIVSHFLSNFAPSYYWRKSTICLCMTVTAQNHNKLLLRVLGKILTPTKFGWKLKKRTADIQTFIFIYIYENKFKSFLYTFMTPCSCHVMIHYRSYI